MQYNILLAHPNHKKGWDVNMFRNMPHAYLDAVALLILDIRDDEVEQRGLGRVRPTLRTRMLV